MIVGLPRKEVVIFLPRFFRWGSFLLERNAVTNKGEQYLVAKRWLWRRRFKMIVVDEPRYKMAIYEAKKEVHVQVIGFIKEDLVEGFLNNLEKTSGMVQKNNYRLVVDATYQSPLPSKVSAGLGGTFMFYASLGFKDIAIVSSKSKISAVQIRNAIETIDFPGRLVNHVSETTSN